VPDPEGVRRPSFEESDAPQDAQDAPRPHERWRHPRSDGETEER
jgi:cytochrome c oxidase subunit I